jgi:hypothetical protein
MIIDTGDGGHALRAMLRQYGACARLPLACVLGPEAAGDDAHAITIEVQRARQANRVGRHRVRMAVAHHDTSRTDTHGNPQREIGRRHFQRSQPGALLRDPRGRRYARRARRPFRIRLREPLLQLALEIVTVQKAALLEERPLTQPTRFSTLPFSCSRYGKHTSTPMPRSSATPANVGFQSVTTPSRPHLSAIVFGRSNTVTKGMPPKAARCSTNARTVPNDEIVLWPATPSPVPDIQVESLAAPLREHGDWIVETTRILRTQFEEARELRLEPRVGPAIDLTPQHSRDGCIAHCALSSSAAASLRHARRTARRLT